MTTKSEMQFRVNELNSQLPQLRHAALTLYLQWEQACAAEELARNERDSLLEIIGDMEQPVE